MFSIEKFKNWYFTKSALPFWAIFIIDCLIVYLSAFLTLIYMDGMLNTVTNIVPVCLTLLLYLSFYMLGFHIFHTYAGIIRFSTFIDLQRTAYAVIIGMVLSFCAKYIFIDYLYYIPNRDIMLWSMFSVMLMWSIRMIAKRLYNSISLLNGQKQAFIFGVKEGGVSIAKSMREQDQPEHTLAGFVSDEAKFNGHTLMGVKVYNLDTNLVSIMSKKQISALFVAPAKSEALRNNAEFVSELIKAGIKIYMVPHEEEWNGGNRVSHNQLREVEIEDLLPRDKISIDIDAIGEQLRGRNVMITGAAGSIGSEMVRQIAQFSPGELILIDQAETPLHDLKLQMAKSYPGIHAFIYVADISNKYRMRDIFADHKPHIVIHAAAYKHVPMMEDNPSESVQNNIIGTKIIADLSVRNGVDKFVMVSTDKAVNPTNVMGCSKRICEIYVQSLDKAIKDGRIKGRTQFVTTRFGNVLGSNGSVIPLFREQIRNGGPVTVTHPEIIRYFMLISEACKLVLEAGTMGNGGEIFVFDMGQPVKIIDLARRMISLSGADVDIKITGLRNGEKLYEEVLNDKESTLPTFHPKIKIARVREYDYFVINDKVKEMADLNYHSDNMEIVRRMKQMVPEYISQHSVYQIIDRELLQNVEERASAIG